MQTKLYQAISRKLYAIANCKQSGNTEWQEKHQYALDTLIKELPSGSGFDSGIKLLDNSTPDRLVFQCDFHHMDECGFYDGWTEHTAIVTPSLAFGFILRITGRNNNNIKEYIADTFHHALNQEIEY